MKRLLIPPALLAGILIAAAIFLPPIGNRILYALLFSGLFPGPDQSGSSGYEFVERYWLLEWWSLFVAVVYVYMFYKGIKTKQAAWGWLAFALLGLSVCVGLIRVFTGLDGLH